MLCFLAHDGDQEGTLPVTLTLDMAVVGDHFEERLQGRLPKWLGVAESETPGWLFWSVVSTEPVQSQYIAFEKPQRDIFLSI